MTFDADFVLVFCFSDAKLDQHVANLADICSITHYRIPCAVQVFKVFNTVLLNRNSIKKHNGLKQLNKISRRDSRSV